MAIVLKSIIIPNARPAIRTENGSFGKLEEPWLELENFRHVIEHAISCVGRIESSDKSIPFMGTAFLVAEDVVLTTRHVVATFASGIGDRQLRIRDDRLVWINFKAETSDDAADCAAVTEVLFIHPYWDVAALRIERQRSFLPLQVSPLQYDSPSIVIGYPAFDMRNDADLQNRIFDNIYNVKRIMPGRVLGEDFIESYGHTVKVITHDASTLGGTAGAPLLDIRTGSVIGVNFAGVYLKANYAVPAWELMRDPRVRRHLEPSWMSLWDKPDDREGKTIAHASEPSVNPTRKYSYVSQEIILELCGLLLQGFPDDERISVLFCGIPPELVAALPNGANTKEKLLLRLIELNRIGLIGKHSPFYTLLQTACHLRELFPEHPRLLAIFKLVAASESAEPM